MFGVEGVNIMKKVVITIILISIICTGCGNHYTSEENSTDTSDSKIDKQEIVIWHPYEEINSKSTIDLAIQEFVQKNSHISVKTEFIKDISTSASQDKLFNAVKGGVPPDIVIVDGFMISQLTSNGLFEDLTEIAKENNITKDLFYDFTWKEVSVDEKLYAIPFDTDTRVLYYNKKLFKQAGLDPQKPPKTIEELDVYAEKLTKRDKTGYKVLGFIPWLGEGWLYTWGWAFDGEFFDSGKSTINDSRIVEALEWERGYAERYNFEEVMHFLVKDGKGIDLFANEKCAMIVDGSWKIAEYSSKYPDLEYGVTFIPTTNQSDFVSWSGGFALAIPKGSENIENALDFIKFMCMGEGAKIHQENTYHLLSHKEINEESHLLNEDPHFKFVIDLLENSRSRPVIPKGKLLWDELISVSETVLRGENTAREVLDYVTIKINEESGHGFDIESTP